MKFARGYTAEKIFSLSNSTNSAQSVVQGVDNMLKTRVIIATAPNLE